MRRFNSKRAYGEKVSGNVNDLMNIPEIRKILVAGKSDNIANIWKNKKFSKKTMSLLKNIQMENEDSKGKNDIELIFNVSFELSDEIEDITY